MPFTCAHCGEELIGNVNRCWRCGNAVISTSDSGEAPPIRRGEVDLDQPVPVAYLVPEATHKPMNVGETVDGENEPDISSEIAETSKATGEPSSRPSLPPNRVRHGSPFRDGGYAASGDAPLTRDVVMPGYPDNELRENFAVASVVVGIMSLFGAAITEWALIPAAVGLALALLGRRSDRRKLAMLGIIIATLAIFFATWKTIIAVRTYFDLQQQMQMDAVMDYY